MKVLNLEERKPQLLGEISLRKIEISQEDWENFSLCGKVNKGKCKAWKCYFSTDSKKVCKHV